MANAKISELPVLQKLGNTGAAPSAARNWDFAYTWNSGGTTFTGLFWNFTDTASAAGSLLFDLQVGGVSKAKCTKAGTATFAGDLNVAGTAFLGSVNSLGVIYGGNYSWALESDGVYQLANRYGTNACTFRVYRTYTNSTNYQRLTHTWNTSTSVIHNEGLGTGADGSIAFNDAALATSATKGFVMIPSCAGVPSGVPADIPTGQIPMVWDSTNLKLYVYTGGAWKSSPVFT